MNDHAAMRLRRELGTFGAVMMGLGAMVGTGVFVSIGIGAGIAGPAVLIALALAAALALANGLSSAQLAAAQPVSGGTYEYGYRYLSSWAGFTAGWVFLIAKSASAATAALGFSGYVLHALGADSRALVPLAAVGVAAVAAVVLAGMRRSNAVNVAIVSVTLLSLGFFVVAGASAVDASNFSPFFGGGSGGGIEDGAGGGETAAAALLEATALMFVGFTGYARIATLGEEVRDPQRSIPRAILLTVGLVLALYLGVAAVGIGVAGSDGLMAATAQQAAPLATVAERFAPSFGGIVLAVGAVTAMLGVLLNLVLGLSRVVLAMARRRDLPGALAALNASRTTPHRAVLVVAAVVVGLVAIGDVRLTWSLSAIAVLIYYSLTNLAALHLPPDARRYPRSIAMAGLAGCVSLALWIERPVLLAGLGAVGVGLLWHAVARRKAAA